MRCLASQFIAKTRCHRHERASAHPVWAGYPVLLSFRAIHRSSALAIGGQQPPQGVPAAADPVELLTGLPA